MSIEDRYILDERLGAGGMAEVFRARRVGINDFSRSVAVKRILGGQAASPKLQEMFAAEARITSQLVHPNIVSVLDFDRDRVGSLCLVMEFVDGCDLSRLTKTGLLPFETVTHIIVEALKGLGHAHRFMRQGIRGVVHRDVSPHNLLLSWQGEVKVSDFGLAKARSVDSATATEGLKGKPAYMSPEQANSQPLDGRSDLFAIGTILWELLVGRPLFGADDSRASLAAILFGTVPPPRQLRPDVPRDLEKVALRLLARERSDRYRTAEAAIAELLACRSANADGRALLSTLLAQRFHRALPPRRPPATAVRTSYVKRGRSVRALFVALVLATLISIVSWSRSHAAQSTAAIAEPIDDRIALVEARPSQAYQPTFKFALDAKELPPSCLLLLDWMFRTARLKLIPASTHADLVRTFENYHDDLARRVTTGESLRYIDETCRRDTWMYRNSSEPRDVRPVPFLDDDLAIPYVDGNSRSTPEFWKRYISATN